MPLFGSSSTITDWTSIAGLGFSGLASTNLTFSGFYRRVNDTAFFRIQALATGAPDFVDQVGFVTPAMFTMDTAKFPSVTFVKIGDGTMTDAATATYTALGVYLWTSTQVRFVWGSQGQTTGVPFSLNTGDSYSAEWSWPVVGW